jgi:phage shock protein B
MSALFLAIPLTIFVLFVLPIWLWLHYSNRSSRGELSQSEQQRLVQLPRRKQNARTHSGAGSDPGCGTSKLEGSLMSGLNLNKNCGGSPAGHGSRCMCRAGSLSRCTGETGACGNGAVDFLWSGVYYAGGVHHFIVCA